MKRLYWIIFILLALTLTACSGLTSTPTPIPTVSLATTRQGNSSAGIITASAVVVPLQDAQLTVAAVGRVASVDVKVGEKVKAGQALIHTDTTLLEAKVREAKANLKAAQIQVDYLKRVGTDERYMDSALADVDRAQALLDSAQATLDDQAALTAPFDGTIVSIDVAPGETVVPGASLIVLGDMSKFRVQTTDLSERDVTRIKTGQPVNISIDALGQTFTGRVAEVSLISSTLGGDVVFTVTIDFDKQPEGLLWGMSADVEIQAE